MKAHKAVDMTSYACAGKEMGATERPAIIPWAFP